MGTAREDLAAVYAAGLAAYVDAPGPATLAFAEVVGRRALDEGAGVLGLTAIHRAAVRGRSTGATGGDPAGDAAGDPAGDDDAAWTFFTAAQAPCHRTCSRLQQVTSDLASMSHDLRTPLNSVIGFSELLDQEVGGPLTSDQKEWIGFVLGGGRKLLAMLDEVLELARLEAGRIQLVPTWTSPRVIAEAVLPVVQPLASKQAVTVALNLGDDLRDVYLDAVRLRQMLCSLVTSAVHGAPVGGVVGLGVGVTDDRLRITVDGARPEATSGSVNGRPEAGARPASANLGLAVTRRLVDMHAGTMTVAASGELTVVLPAPPRTT